jgi:hypothetical protein
LVNNGLFCFNGQGAWGGEQGVGIEIERVQSSVISHQS